MTHKTKTLLMIVVVTFGIAGITAGFLACDTPPVTQRDAKNRVPDVQTAQKASTDAQAAAASAQESLNAIQAKIDALQKAEQAKAPTVISTSDGTPQEQTRIGRVTDVTEVFEVESSSYQYGEAYEAVTFVDDTGFQKRFYPVCSDQAIQTGKPAIIMYHWKPNLNNGHHNQKGCFTIDGYLYAPTTNR